MLIKSSNKSILEFRIEFELLAGRFPAENTSRSVRVKVNSSDCDVINESSGLP